MKRLILILLIFSIFYSCSKEHAKLKVAAILCNKVEHPTGIESKHPVLSWVVESQLNGASQSAYQILVADSREQLDNNAGNLWDSGKQQSNQSINVSYAGEQLKSAKKYYWKVKVWDNHGNESNWSEIASWQMGLLSDSDWENAQWIGFEEMDSSKRVVEGVTGYGSLSKNKVEERAVVPLFRKGFDLTNEIESATLFISGLGQYEASINGDKVVNDFLTPGWSHYDETVLYNTYDVSSQLNQGGNAIGVIVGNGFLYNNRERYRKLVIAYGFPKMICKLLINYTNGETQTIVSDKSWLTKPSAITFSSIYGGEDYDARLAENGWNLAGFDAVDWKPVQVVKAPSGKLTADNNHPIRIMETFDPIAVSQINDSVWIYDFGQNASGIVSLKIKGEKGQQVQLWSGEVLKEDGFIDQRGSGSPYFYAYTLKGGDAESWQPRFTYYGFRYVQVTGASPENDENEAGNLPEIIELKSLHTRNSMPQTGQFECSNELMNQTFDLINWAIKSNSQSVSTDCPTREKLGWIEQTYLMGESVHFNFNIYHLYKSLIRNMKDAQTEAGLVPNIVPEYVNFDYYDTDFSDSPSWGVASVVVPWKIYKWYADPSVMKDAWPMMEDYMSYLESKSSDYTLSHGLGDWYDIGSNPPGFAQLTPVSLVATATYFYAARQMAQMAEVLNKNEEAKKYHSLAEKIKEAFNQRFYKAKKKLYSTGSQTAMAMPLSLGMVPAGDEQQVLQNLIDSIHSNNNEITAGDIGFHYLVDALTKYGASELLFEMNNRDDVPGYGYQLEKGATSLTESWMSLPSKSMNHLMLGHLMEWFYKGLGGIQQNDQSVGYKHVVIYPEIVEDIDFVKASYESPYGTIQSDWEKKADHLILNVEIPFNTTAKIYLPFNGEVKVNNGSDVAGNEPTYKYLGEEGDRMIYETGSGVYKFTVQHGK